MKSGSKAFWNGLDEDKAKARPTWARLGILMALLLTAGVLLWRQSPQRLTAGEPDASVRAAPSASISPAPTGQGAAESGRTARELAYDKDVNALTSLISKENVSEGIRDQAAQQLAQMIANHTTELAVEEALLHAGFAPCLAVLQNDALTVSVGIDELTSAQSGAILAVCVAHSDVAAENIRIMTADPRLSS